ncbi:hypothetical protein [Pseudonocardia sp. 73-21]|uniref:hypothetical protein n=1 Tax=Pseudonocardia sp. 73-21 TaxID=1895809 RepID=UPI00095FC158|nr:hypothetical protein [Pseudonocardia sp. 73-21]OJY45183.1 MAG: hypothetical protein BGP03_15315 [Pseudonocardia sp. 73-21]
MDDYVRRCALPGCDVPIDDIPGRPARRYCTAAHRAAARHARRASMQPDQQERLAETLPWLREPDPEPVLVRPSAAHAEPERTVRVPAPRAVSPAGRGLAARLGDRLPRRRRAIAVIGAAGILAGGYAVTSSQSTEVAGPVAQTPQGESSDGWAARAQVTLTSVDRQLDTIAQTEAAWNAMPEHATVGTPAAVAELMDRKALLERRKAALQSQLDTYRALARTKADLELSEQNLDAVEKALKDAPTTGAVTSPDEASALAALQEQRDLRIRQRDAKKLELAGIEGNVEKAARAPLPDDGQQTTVVSEKVLDVIHNGGRDGGRPTSPTPGPRRPEVLASGREGEQGQERQATTTSAPPDPRGPRDESAERRSEPRPAAAPKGPVGGVVDTVDGALGGGKPDPNTGDRSRGPVGKVADTVGGVLGAGKQETKPAAADKAAADKPAADKPAEQPKGPVGKAVDTLGGAVDGLVGGGKGQKESTPKESSPKKSSQKENKPEQSAAAKPAADDGAGRSPTPRSAPARSAPAATPARTGGDLAGSMPGAEMAMAIVSSVPGGEAAAPAMESALRQAATQYAEQAGASTTTVKSSGSPSSGSQSSSRKTPTHLTTTVVDDSGSTHEQSSRSSSSGDGSSRTSSGGTAYSSSSSSGTSSQPSTSSQSSTSGSNTSRSSTSGSGTSSSDKSGSGSSGSGTSSRSGSGTSSGSGGSSSSGGISDPGGSWSSDSSSGSGSASSDSSGSGSRSSSDWSGSGSSTDYSAGSDRSN